MPVVKKQHYVPQYYLRNFADNQSRLFVFDKPTLKSHATNVRDIANESYFYDQDPESINTLGKVIKEQKEDLLKDIENDAIATRDHKIIKYVQEIIQNEEKREEMLNDILDKQFIEKKILAPHDDRSAELLKKFVEDLSRKGKVKKISATYRNDLAFLMSVQYLRTRKHRDAKVELIEKTNNALINKGWYGDEYKDYRVEFDRTYEAKEHIAALTDMKFLNAITSILKSHIWRIGINKSSYPLYTSDAPIVMKGHINHPNMGVGIASPGIEIAFPITPKLILILWHRQTLKHLENLDGRAINLNNENVIYYNGLQVVQSQRQVYCSVQDFDLALKICNENPSLREPKRPQMTVT